MNLHEVSEEILADILSVSDSIVKSWRETGKITPQPNGLYDLTLLDLPQVRAMLDYQPDPVIPARTYRSIEMFAGGGGFALGLEKAGFHSVGLYEKDKDACQTLRTNRPQWNVVEQDVTTVDFTEHQDIDLLVGGFPCQAFSDAGKRMGFDDTRGTMFYEFARAIKESRPKVFVGENVRGLLSHDNGRTIEVVTSVLRSLGYTLVEPVVLKAIFYRVPQKRERLFLVGIRNDLVDGVDFYWPHPHRRVYTLRDALKAGDLYPTDCPPSDGAAYPPKRKAILDQVPPGGNWEDLPEDVWRKYIGVSIGSGGGMTSTARRLDWDSPSLTLLCTPSQKQTERCHPDETRPLTVREYARVQTFPDDWVFSGSRGSQYAQIGNAVPVNLGFAVGGSLVRLLNAIEGSPQPVDKGWRFKGSFVQPDVFDLFGGAV